MAAGYAGFAEAPLDLLKRYFGEAANEVLADAMAASKPGANICLETVLSTPKYHQGIVQQVIKNAVDDSN